MMELRNKFQKIFIKIFIVIVALFLALGLCVEFAISPEYVSKHVTHILKELTPATVHLKGVKISLLRNFPNLGVRIDSLLVVAPQDTTAIKDTVIKIPRAIVRLNVASLVAGKYVVNEFTLEKPSIYAIAEEDGSINLESLLPQKDSVETEIDTSSFNADDIWAYHIRLKKIVIKEGDLYFYDKENNTEVHSSGLNFEFRGGIIQKGFGFRTKCSCDSLDFSKDGESIIKSLPLSLDARLGYSRDSSKLYVNKAKIGTNIINANTEGVVSIIKDERSLDIDLGFSFNIPSFKTLVSEIPSFIIEKTAKIDAKGEIASDGRIKGRFGNGQLPVISAEVSLNDGFISYGDMPLDLDKLSVRADALIDFSNENKSYINIDTIQFNGGRSHMFLSTKITRPTTSPIIESQIKTDIDMDEMTQIFPLNDSIVCKGQLKSDLFTAFHMKDIQNGNFGRVKAKGIIGSKSLVVKIPSQDLLIEWGNVGVRMGESKTELLRNQDKIAGTIGFRKLYLKYKNMWNVIMDTTYTSFSIPHIDDTSVVAKVDAQLKLGRSRVVMNDTLLFELNRGKANMNIVPSAANDKFPLISVNAVVSDFDSHYLYDRLKVGQAKADLSVEKRLLDKKERWVPQGTIGVEKLEAITPTFPLPICVNSTYLTLKGSRVLLDSTLLHIGRSDMRVTGYVENIAKWKFRGDTLSGDFNFVSNMLDFNELISAANKGGNYRDSISNQTVTLSSIEKVEPTEQVEDSLLSVFVVPERTNLRFSANVDKARFANLDISKMSSNVRVADRRISLKDLDIQSSLAKIEGGMVYHAEDKDSAYTGFKINIYNIQIDSIHTLIPSIHELFPMLKSFEGKVDFMMAGDTKLDSTLTVNIPSVRGILSMKGRDLVLMDSETFGNISKQLKFKNRKKNMIDSIDVSAKIKDGKAYIYPFLISIDRYDVAVGGEQNIDMSFNYHISLLKSPILFKVGLDIKGTPDDIKYKLTKAKYKDTFKPAKTKEIDSESFKINQLLEKMFN